MVGDATEAGKQKPTSKISIGKQGFDNEIVKEAVTRKTSNLKKVDGRESTSEYAKSVLGTATGKGDIKASVMPNDKLHGVEEVKKKKETMVESRPANGVILIVVKSGKNASERSEKERIKDRSGQDGFTNGKTAANKENAKESSENHSMPSKETTIVTSISDYLRSNQERITSSSDQSRHRDGEKTGNFETTLIGNKRRASLPDKTARNDMTTITKETHNSTSRKDGIAMLLTIQKGKGGNYYASNAPARKLILNGELNAIESDRKETSRKRMPQNNNKQNTSIDERVSKGVKGSKKSDNGNIDSEKKQKSKSNAQKSRRENIGDKLKKNKAPSSKYDRIRISGTEEIVKITKNMRDHDQQETSTEAALKNTKNNVTSETVANYAKLPDKDAREKGRKPLPSSGRVLKKLVETEGVGNDKAGTIKENKTKFDVDRVKENKRPKDGKTTTSVSDRNPGSASYRAPKPEKKNEQPEIGHDTSGTKQEPVNSDRPLNKATVEGEEPNSNNSREKKVPSVSNGAIKRRTERRNTKLNTVTFSEVREKKEPHKEEDIQSGSDRKSNFGAGGTTVVERTNANKGSSKGVAQKSANNVAMSDKNITSRKRMQQMKENYVPNTNGRSKAWKSSTAESDQEVKRKLADVDLLPKENASNKRQERKKITTSSNKRKLGYGDGAVPYLISNSERGSQKSTIAVKQDYNNGHLVKDRVRGNGEGGRSEKKKEEMADSYKPAKKLKEFKETANVLHAERNTTLHSSKSFEKFKKKNELGEGRATTTDSVRKGNVAAVVIVLQPNSSKSVIGKIRGDGYGENSKNMREKQKKLMYRESKLGKQIRRKEGSKSVLDKDQKTLKGNQSLKRAAKENVLKKQKNTTSRKYSESAQVFGAVPKARKKNEERPNQIMSHGSTQKVKSDENVREKTEGNEKESGKEKKEETNSDKASEKVEKSNIKENGGNK
ncbi:unnamed protein product, partial [Cylicostephanus goldi]